MREILFRGKRIDNGEWIEGYYALSPTDSKSYIYAKDYTEVDIAEDGLHVAYRLMQVIPETVGQFVGLTDKNGTKVFEGDVIRVKYSLRCPTKFGTAFSIATYSIDYIASVTFGDCRFYLTKANGEVYEIPLSFENIEVIGNVHDNPELLEVE